jgi:tetratricopeptide (TPR) repeat protein
MQRTISTALCLIFALTFLTSCAQLQQPPTAAELLNLGEKYLLELDYEQALVQFLAVIEIEPMNPRGYTGAAQAYVGLGRVEEAVAVLEQGLETTGDDSVSSQLEELLMTPHQFIETNENGEAVSVFGQTDLEGRKQGFCIINVFKQDTMELIYLAEGDFVDDQPVGMLKNWWFPDTNINEHFGVENGCGRGVGEHINGVRNGKNTVECYIGYTIHAISEGELVRFDDCSGERLVYAYKGNMVDGEPDDDSGNAYQMYFSRQEAHYGDKVEFIGQFKNGEKNGYVKRWREGMLEYEGYWNEDGPTGDGQWYDIGR